MNPCQRDRLARKHPVLPHGYPRSLGHHPPNPRRQIRELKAFDPCALQSLGVPFPEPFSQMVKMEPEPPGPASFPIKTGCKGSETAVRAEGQRNLV